MVNLSIVIPMYNSELTIKKCIDSIGESHEIEVIMVDDGSIDKTKEICCNYLQKSMFKYIYQDNGGPGAARNKGISYATGKYIMFLDSDDYVDTQILNKIIKTYLPQNYDMIYYGFDQVTETGTVLKHHNLSMFNGVNKDNLITYTLSWKLPWGQFKIIKRSILYENRISFNEIQCDSEELVFTLNCIEKSERIYFYEESLYKYYKRNGSISTNAIWENLYKTRLSIIKILRRLYGNEYNLGINNYQLVSNIQIFKLLAEQSNGFNGFKVYKNELQREVRSLLKTTDTSYLEKRYQYIYRCLKLRMDILLYVAFKALKMR